MRPILALIAVFALLLAAVGIAPPLQPNESRPRAATASSGQLPIDFSLENLDELDTPEKRQAFLRQYLRASSWEEYEPPLAWVRTNPSSFEIDEYRRLLTGVFGPPPAEPREIAGDDRKSIAAAVERPQETASPAGADFEPLGWLAWRVDLRSRDPIVRNRAVEVVLKAIHNDRDVVRILCADLPMRITPEERLAWREMLVPHARVAVPYFIANLDQTPRQPGDAGWTERTVRACNGLACLGAEAWQALPSLQSLLNDSRVEIRRAAAVAAWNIDGSAMSLLPLVAASQNETTPSEGVTGDFPSNLGPAAVPALLKLAYHERADVRSKAGRLLDYIDADRSPSAEGLAELLANPDPRVREEAAIHLAKLGPNALPAVPALIRAAEDRSEFVRMFAIDALGAIGPEAKAAVPTLTRILSGDNLALRASAKSALARIQSAGTN